MTSMTLFALITILIEWTDPVCIPKAVGWEPNIEGKLSSRIISLAESMNPERYALKSYI